MCFLHEHSRVDHHRPAGAERDTGDAIPRHRVIDGDNGRVTRDGQVTHLLAHATIHLVVRRVVEHGRGQRAADAVHDDQSEAPPRRELADQVA